MYVIRQEIQITSFFSLLATNLFFTLKIEKLSRLRCQNNFSITVEQLRKILDFRIWKILINVIFQRLS